jgi:arylsulfatase A-like enzyme
MILALALLAGCKAPEPGLLAFGNDPPQQILIVSIDTLRRDRIGRYDPRGPGRTPALDAFLESSIALDDHRSCSSWTYASMMCALTGAYNEDLGFVPARDTGLFTALPEGIDTLPAWLDGWDSTLISANPVMGPDTALDRDYGTTCASCTAATQAPEVADRGLAAIDGLEPPWLAHLHFMDPHLPYTAPAPYTDAANALPALGVDLTQGWGVEIALEQWDSYDDAQRAAVLTELELRYDAQIAYLDDQLARVFDGLESRGLADDTLVVLWSDHGEQFFDHGGIKHGQSVYAEETRAIAAFRHPALTPRAVSEPTTHADLVPTLLAGLGMQESATTGRVLGASSPGARFTSSLSHKSRDTRLSVDEDGWRLIFTFDGTLELYNLRDDPTELVDLAADDPSRVATLWAMLERRVEQTAEAEGAPELTWPSVPPG